MFTIFPRPLDFQWTKNTKCVQKTRYRETEKLFVFRNIIKNNNGPFSQDCDDAHQHRKSLKVFYIWIFFKRMYIITLYFVLYHLCIK